MFQSVPYDNRHAERKVMIDSTKTIAIGFTILLLAGILLVPSRSTNNQSFLKFKTVAPIRKEVRQEKTPEQSLTSNSDNAPLQIITSFLATLGKGTVNLI